jgi:Bacterial Ig domain
VKRLSPRGYARLVAGALLVAGCCLIALEAGSASAAGSPACSQGSCTVEIGYTGGPATWTVPPGVSSAAFTLYGASGGNGGQFGGLRVGTGGLGAEVSGTLGVTAGVSFTIAVGGAGGAGPTGTGGFNAGGAGGSGGQGSGGGGGATSVASEGALVLLAGGGGGGSGGAGTPSLGGDGGAADAAATPGGSEQGLGDNVTLEGGAAGGSGESSPNGGAGGTSSGTENCPPAYVQAGVSGVSGSAGSGGSAGTGGGGGTAGGGGGAGATGGGQGGQGAIDCSAAAGYGGGGGGSSFLGSATNTSGPTTAAAPDNSSGNGEAIITYSNPVVAGSPSYRTTSNQTLTVGAADGVLATPSGSSVPTGDSVTAAVVTGPTHGSLTLNSDGSFSYTPNAGFVGSDSFTYSATGLSGDGASGTVSLTVAAPSTSSAPAATSSSAGSTASVTPTPPPTTSNSSSAATIATSNPAKPKIVIASRVVTLAARTFKAPVRLTCDTAACSGSLEILETVTKRSIATVERSKSDHSKTVATTTSVVLARASYHLAEGTSKTFDLEPTTLGLATLERASTKAPLHVLLTATVKDGRNASEPASVF